MKLIVFIFFCSFVYSIPVAGVDASMENIRFDSTSIISSLQKDYGDSDDEDSEKKNTSSDNLVIEKTTELVVPVTTELVVPLPETDKTAELVKDNSVQGSDKEETSANVPSQTNEVDDPEKEEYDPEVKPDELISDDDDGEHHDRPKTQPQQPDKDTLRIQSIFESIKTESPSSQGSTHPGRKG